MILLRIPELSLHLQEEPTCSLIIHEKTPKQDERWSDSSSSSVFEAFWGSGRVQFGCHGFRLLFLPPPPCCAGWPGLIQDLLSPACVLQTSLRRHLCKQPH